MEQGDVGVADEDFGVGADEVVVEVGEELVGVDATDGADDGADGRVAEGGVDFVAAVDDGLLVGQVVGDGVEDDVDFTDQLGL